MEQFEVAMRALGLKAEDEGTGKSSGPEPILQAG